jgi:hypothetical protein
MNADALLTNIRVASPCTARWADMTSDDCSRFCAQCQKQVYNLSEMTAEDASDVIRQKEGKLCVRFYKREDGTVLTADCPVGAAAIWRRAKRLAAAAVGLLVSGLAMSIVAADTGRRPEKRLRPKAYQAWDGAISAVRDFVNPKQPPILMGEVCVPTLPTNSPSTGTNPPPSRKSPPPKARERRTA